MNRRYPAAAVMLCIILLLSFPVAAAEWVPAASAQPGFHITDVALSGDGAYGAIAGDGGVILLRADGEECWRIPEGGYRSVSLSGNGSILAAGGDGIVMMDKNSTVLGSVRSKNYVNDLSVTADGTRIAAAVDDETLRLYTPAGLPVWSTDTGDDLVSVAISPDGTYIAGGTVTGNVVLFSASGDERWTYTLSRQPVTSVAVADGARSVGAVSEDGAVCILSRAGGLFWSGSASHAGGVAVSADGASAAVADREGIRLIERDGTPVSLIPAVDASVAAVMDTSGNCIAVTEGVFFSGFTNADAAAPDMTVQPTEDPEDAGETGTSSADSHTPAPSGSLPIGEETPVPTRTPFPLIPLVGGLLCAAGAAAAGGRLLG